MRVTPIKPLPPIGRFAITLGKAIGDTPSEVLRHKMEQLIKYRENVHTKDLARLASALRGLAKRYNNYADRLED